MLASQREEVHMKSKIIIIITLGIIFWFLNRETLVDKLMQADFPITASTKSGKQYYDPERNETVDMSRLIEDGLVTVIHLSKSSCNGCKIFNRNIDKLLLIRPDVAVVEVPAPGSVGYRATNRGKELNVKFVPFILIYDKTGKLVAVNDGDKREGTDIFMEWLSEEIDRKNTQLRDDWVKNKFSQY